MIRPGFVDSESRHDLIELIRDGPVAYRLVRRANALVLLDDGMRCEAVAKVLSWRTTRPGAGIGSIKKMASRLRRVSATKVGGAADSGATRPADRLDHRDATTDDL
jgi:hypothetical protein